MQRYSHFRLAILMAVAGLVVTLTIAIALVIQDNQQVRRYLAAEVEELQHEINSQIRHHMFGLTWLARHQTRYLDAPNTWVDEAPVLVNSYPHFRFLLWFDENLQLINGYTTERNIDLATITAERLNIDLNTLQANERVLIPTRLLGANQFELGLLVTINTRRGTQYFIGVMDARALLSSTVTEFLDNRTQFRLSAPHLDLPLFEVAGDESLRERWRGVAEFGLFGQQWKMEMWPNRERLNSLRSWVPLLVALAGLVTTGLMTFVLYTLGISRVRAQELADTNIDLYAEIEERERVEKRMAYLAEHDRLTDLANRNSLLDRLKEFFADAQRHATHVGVLFIDLDNFKDVNDALGHSLGDELLKRVATRLLRLAPSHSCLARMGGDEYVLAIAGLDGLQQLTDYAKKVLAALDTHFYVEEYEIFISASIGVALSQPDIDDAESIVRNADTALYRAKESGPNSYHVYTEVLHQELNVRMELMKRLRHAVEHNKLTVYYQPKVDMQQRRIIGAEALVRWIDDDGNIIGPDKFIPIAEDTGLIIPISEFVLRTACKQLAAWHALGFSDLSMAVNLSGKQLQSPDLVAHIMAVVHATQIPASSLELELTEQVFIENIQSHTNFMHAIRERGISLSIDDFGIGYSSLSYLKHFPVTALKIDRSFVQDLPHDKDDATLTQTIINLATSLDIGLVAEGVETEAQVEFLLDRDCNIGQGFLFSRPIPAEEFTQLLNDYQGQIPIRIM